MTIYAHITNGAVDQVGAPPATAYAAGRWWDLRTLDPDALTACGWQPLVELPRPADTSTATADLSYALVDGAPTQVWTIRDKTQAELDAVTVATNETALLTKARTALTVNATYIALAAPTNAQTVAQVKALARQVNALIKLRIGDLLDTSGT